MARNMRPWHEVEKLTGGAFEFPVMHVNEKAKTIDLPNGDVKTLIMRSFDRVTVTKTEVYMVYYPSGHSICVACDDHEQIARLGLEREMPVVDMLSGQIMYPNDGTQTPKAAVMRKTKNAPRERGGLSTLDKED